MLRVRCLRGAWIEGSPKLPMTEGSGNCVIHVACSWDSCCGRRVVSAVKSAELFSYKGHSLIDGPLAAEDGIDRQGEFGGWGLRVIDDVYLPKRAA